MDNEWKATLPGEDYERQNPDVLSGAAMVIGTRASQQDAFAIRWIGDSSVAAMVCDGMGGLEGGDKASKMAIASVMQGIHNLSEEEWTLTNFFEIIKKANEAVREMKDEAGNSIECGTTMTLALVKEKMLVWMSIGDSCIYYRTAGRMQRITREHNYAFINELQKNDEQLVLNPETRRDALVSYMGAPVLKYVDYNIVPWPLEEDDILMLCSDGLTKLLTDKEIEEILCEGESELNNLAERLIGKAIMHADGTQDNTTVVLLKYKEES